MVLGSPRVSIPPQCLTCSEAGWSYAGPMARRSKTVASAWLSMAIAAAACGGSTRAQPIGGIHARLGYSEGGGLRVVDTPLGGAAAIAGLRPDDVILTINGESVRAMPYQEIVERLRGPVGSSVQLGVFRDREVHTVVVMREAYR